MFQRSRRVENYVPRICPRLLGFDRGAIVTRQTAAYCQGARSHEDTVFAVSDLNELLDLTTLKVNKHNLHKENLVF